MDKYRGMIVQLATLFAIVGLVAMSKIADSAVLHYALGTIGGVYGANTTRARFEAANGVLNGTQSSITQGLGRSIPPIVGGVLGFVLLFFFGNMIAGCAQAKPIVIDATALVCTEVVDSETNLPPDLVKIACQDASGAIVNLIMPRRAAFATFKVHPKGQPGEAP